MGVGFSSIAPSPKHDNPSASTDKQMQAQYTGESDSNSMDDIVFVRSAKKRCALPLSGGPPAKREKSRNAPVQPVSPSPAPKERVSGDRPRATASDFFAKVPRPEQWEPEQQVLEQQESFLLATRHALEQPLGKEALQAHEKLLAKEKESTEQYIVNLEAAVKQQYGTPMVHDILVQNQIAMLKAKAEGQDESARTEIKLLRKSNNKLADEKTTLGRCVQHLTDENINLKRQDEAARAEIQILHENNTKLIDENSALMRNIKAFKDEHGIARTKSQEEATRTQVKILRENNMKLTEEKTALARKVNLLKGEIEILQIDISVLTQAVRDQKKLNKKRMHESIGSIKDAAHQNKKLRRKFEQHNKRLMRENTILSRKVVELEGGNSAEDRNKKTV